MFFNCNIANSCVKVKINFRLVKHVITYNVILKKIGIKVKLTIIHDNK